MVEVWRWLTAGEWRAYPLRFLLAGLAIAIGVSLGFAVHVINRSAADSFAQAVRSASGEADLQVRATAPLGFEEGLYPRLFALAEVADASPVIQIDVLVGEDDRPTGLLGIDMLRALTVTPGLLGRQRGAGEEEEGERRPSIADAAFDADAIYLSEAALERSGAALGGPVRVRAGGFEHVFTVRGDLPGAAAGQALALVDIAAAQWRFGRLGTLDRIDIRLTEGAGVRAIEAALPAGATLTDPERQARRGDSLSRAYRVNLDMLALVALITGGFLVFSAQSLSVTRRLRQFALLRTIGMRRATVERQLVGEGLALGLVGGLLGLGLGYGLGALAMRFVGGDLGGGYFAGTAPELVFAPEAALLFLALGVGTAVAGSLVPARQAARIEPAEALRNAGELADPRRRPPWKPAALLVALGAGAAFLPAVGRLPLFGYLAVGLILAGAIAGMPWLARALLRPLARLDLRMPSFDLALRHLVGAPGQASIALAGIVASTGLMIAMAIMVTSFRGSVEDWLDTLLTGDLYVQVPRTGPQFDPALQDALREAPGVASISFSMGVPLTIDPDLPPVVLVVRPVDSPGYRLPVMETAGRPEPGAPLWFSEPAARLHGMEPGEPFTLPIGAAGLPGHVAGIWRDYARQQGAILIDEAYYVRATGDRDRNEAEIALEPGADPARVREEVRRRLPPAMQAGLTVAEPAALRAEALRLFDRSFAITYVLEAIAILIGLAGVAATISAQTIARIREFGMLRHIGMRPRQIVAMLASEGALLGLIGLAAGAALGTGLSQILIQVINPQSFNWTMQTRFPWALLAGVAAAMVLAAAGTAVLAGRRAVSRDAVRAVSEDW